MTLSREEPAERSAADPSPPLRALLVYESMFGNTEAVALAVADGLRGAGCAVDVVDVGTAGAADTTADHVGHDLLVVGAPTHAFSLSRPSTRRDAVRQGGRPAAAETGLREWIGTLRGGPGPQRTLAAAFDTRVAKVRRLPKAASTRAHHSLCHLGFTLVARPTGFLVTDIQGDLVDGELERAALWGQHLAAKCRCRLVEASTGSR